MATPMSELRQRIRETSLRQTAAAIGVSAAYLSDIMNGKRKLGPKVSEALGYERQVVRKVVYTRKNPTNRGIYANPDRGEGSR